MKLTKDQIQKIVLGLMMMVGLIYAFFEFMLRPLGVSRDAAIKTEEELQPKILAAKAQIAKTKAIELEGPRAREIVDQVRALIPDGSPVAWFPPRIADFCKANGMERVSTRMNNESAEKELTGFRRLNWGIEIPEADFGPFGAALAELENEEPLIEIQSLTIESGRDNVGHQRVVLNVNNLVRL
jgi:hypothetical protein